MSGLRLLCVYQHAPTPGAPGIYRHRLLLAELVRRGWAVDLVSTPVNYMTGDVPPRYRRRPLVRERIDGIDHHWVWAPAGIHASKARRLANYAGFATSALARGLALKRPDVVLVSSPPLSVGALGPLLALRYRRPWVLEVRDVWPESAAAVGWLDPSSGVYRAVERLAHGLAARAAAVVVPTPGLVPDVLRHGATRACVVSGAVVELAPDPGARAAVRRELGVADEACLFLYLGSVGVANGLDALLDAALLLPPGVPAEIVVIGGGSALEALHERVRRQRLQRVRLLGPVPKAAVGRYLSAADVCLHLLRPDPTFAAALPTKVLEYLGAQRPFVTTVAGLPERLALATGGAFAPTPERLADELARWASLTPGERARRGEEALRFGRERFGLDVVASRLERVLADAMAGPARGTAQPAGARAG